MNEITALWERVAELEQDRDEWRRKAAIDEQQAADAREDWNGLRKCLDIIDRRADDALAALYGIDHEEGSRVARAVEAVEAIRAALAGKKN